ncbi:hypothetical protein ULMS_17580 [Patiriisocius marinistellae]|uniref:Uncharacterized protein n=1 Tax=Patiriisocius marinistellae TaxID=2494560 RepID=A0A5J4FW01_9FLAO|nr:hypothetical protein ULMS_17580 [Patiriisocius marinistellae]
MSSTIGNCGLTTVYVSDLNFGLINNSKILNNVTNLSAPNNHRKLPVYLDLYPYINTEIIKEITTAMTM